MGSRRCAPVVGGRRRESEVMGDATVGARVGATVSAIGVPR